MYVTRCTKASRIALKVEMNSSIKHDRCNTYFDWNFLLRAKLNDWNHNLNNKPSLLCTHSIFIPTRTRKNIIIWKKDAGVFITNVIKIDEIFSHLNFTIINSNTTFLQMVRSRCNDTTHHVKASKIQIWSHTRKRKITNSNFSSHSNLHLTQKLKATQISNSRPLLRVFAPLNHKNRKNM